MSPLSEVLAFSYATSRGCLVDSSVGPEIDALPAHIQVCHPPPFVSGNSRYATGVILIRARSVPAILGGVGESEVCTTIVKSIAVDVVDAHRVSGGQVKDPVVQAHLRNGYAANTSLVVVPFFALYQRHGVAVDNSAEPVKPHFDICKVPLNADPRRFVPFSSLPEVSCG